MFGWNDYREDGKWRKEQWGKKWCFWLFGWGWKRIRDFGGAHTFSFLLHQNMISPNGREKWVKIFGQNCPHFFFFWVELNVVVVDSLFFGLIYLFIFIGHEFSFLINLGDCLFFFWLVVCLLYFIFFNWASFLIRTYE